MDAKKVENKTIRSFNVLKQDIRKMTEWISWNQEEHEMLKKRLAMLEVRQTKYVASAKSMKVHKEKSSHARKIQGINMKYFDMLSDARQLGYSVCECAA